MAVTVITIIFGSSTVADKIRTQKKYDKLVEFQELASPISVALLSQANSVINKIKTAVLPYFDKHMTQKDRYGVDRKFWEVHAIYEPLIPEDLWERFGGLGKAYNALFQETNIENAKGVVDAYNTFTEQLKQTLKWKKINKK